ncbi:MAG TPA: alcohol dehydrogenase catalytic domain-containing protein [Longimicrobiales bacterium]
MLAVRFHYRPARYLLTRFAARRRPGLAYSGFGCVSLDDVAPPALPGPDWVRIDTTLSGICGSDLAAVTAHDSFTLEPFGAFPFTFGHENIGRIAETGSNVTGWKAGHAVAVNPMLSCAQRGIDPVCDACARGDYGLCRRTTDGVVGNGPMIGYNPVVGGGWSASFVAHQSQLHDITGMRDEVAVLVDPFASALRPVLLHPPSPGDVVLVIGAGSIGLLTIAALRATGWGGPIVVMARHPFQAELAKKAGATEIVESRSAMYGWAERLPGARAFKPSLAPRFVEGGPSLVYDTVGTQGSVGDCMALTREGGRIVLVGAAAKIAVDWTRLWYRQLTVAGIFAYGSVPFEGRTRDIYDVALDLLRRIDMEGLGLVTHVYELEEYRAALAAALDKGGSRSIKVAIRPR